MIGSTPIALLISVLVALYVLGGKRGEKASALEKTIDGALGPVCSVILITGAGGMFGGVLRASGIGKALADSMGRLGYSCFAGLFLGGFGFAYCARFCNCCPDYRCRVDGTGR